MLQQVVQGITRLLKSKHCFGSVGLLHDQPGQEETGKVIIHDDDSPEMDLIQCDERRK
jgi:hypothetical protein